MDVLEAKHSKKDKTFLPPCHLPDIFSGPSTSKEVRIEPMDVLESTPLKRKPSPLHLLSPTMVSRTKEQASSPPPLLSPTIATQTPSFLSSGTPRKLKLRSKIKCLQRTKSKETQEQPFIEDFNNLCDKFLEKPLAQIIKAHVQLKHKKPISRRYSMEVKQFALALYFLSPKAYRYVSKMLTLPDKRTLERLTEKLECQPGLQNKSIYKALEIKLKTMTSKDRHCVLCIDEMSIKSNLYFDLKSDKIIGFEDTGYGDRGPQLCKNVLVIMARGLYSSWKQPIAFFFVATQLKADKLRPILEKCIVNLRDIDLTVEAISSDMGSNFIDLSKCLGITPENTEFQIEGHNLVYIFDPCHLIKATRNNLRQHTFCFQEKKTSWSYIDFFLQLRQEAVLQMCTQTH